MFPHPVEIDPSGLGKSRLIVPAAWQVIHGNLQPIKLVHRTVAKESIDSYKISLHGGKATIRRKPYPGAGRQLEFQVFEAV